MAGKVVREGERSPPTCVHVRCIRAGNPLAGGMLTGKYKRGAALPPGARFDAFEVYRRRYYTEQTFDIVEAFVAAARERGVTPAQLALA